MWLHLKSYVACLNGESIIFIALQLGAHDAILVGRFLPDIIKLFWYYRIQIGRLTSHKNDGAYTILSVDRNRFVCAWLTSDIFNVCADKIGHGSVASELYWNLEKFLYNLLSKNGKYWKELLYLFLIKLLIWYQQDFIVYVIRHQNV